MLQLEALEMILVFTGFLIIGIGFLVAYARNSSIAGKKTDHRKEFFRLVEAAREAEILEKRPIAYNIAGIWKGEGDGYFGVGKNLEIHLVQTQSNLAGRLIDQFGYSEVRGFFVWPYIWFDFERHGTVFEFRGIIKETSDGASIAGKYRYFMEDAEWHVKRIEVFEPAPQVVSQSLNPNKSESQPVSGKVDGAGEGKTKQAIAKSSSDGWKDVGFSPEEMKLLDTASLPLEPLETEASTERGVKRIAPEDFPVLPEFPPIDEERIKPVPRGDTQNAPYVRGKSGKCSECGNALEEFISFCIYCGAKKES